MRLWQRVTSPLLEGGEDPSAEAFAGDRADRVENAVLGGVGAALQVPDWRTAATSTNGAGTENVAVVGGGPFNTQGALLNAVAGVAFGWAAAATKIYVHPLGNDLGILGTTEAYTGYVPTKPPQVTGFEMFGRYYACPYGQEAAASRLGMGYYDPAGPSYTIPTFDLGGGAAPLRFRGIAKHRGGTILGFGFDSNASPDASHLLRYCKYTTPDTWAPDTTPTTAGKLVVGTLNVPIVACAASGNFTIIGKTSEVFALGGDYSAQFYYDRIGAAHGPVSTAGMVSTGPLAVWMSESGPAYSMHGGPVQLILSQRVLRRMTTYQDLGLCSAVHDAPRTRVGFLLRRVALLDGTPAGGYWPDEILWWDYTRDALTVHKAPTTCTVLFTAQSVNPTLPGPTGVLANLVAVPSTSGAVLTWDYSVGDPTSVVSIEYRPQGVTPWTVVGPTTAGATTWSLTGLTGTGYECRVRQVKNGQYSAYTATLTFTLAVVPAAPTNVAVAFSDAYDSKGTIYVVAAVTWTQTEFSSGATAEVYEATSNSFAAATLFGAGQPVGTTSWPVTKVSAATPTYYYWVLQRLPGRTASGHPLASGSPFQYLP